MKYYKMKQNDALQYISLQEPFENCHVISNVAVPFHIPAAVSRVPGPPLPSL